MLLAIFRKKRALINKILSHGAPFLAKTFETAQQNTCSASKKKRATRRACDGELENKTEKPVFCLVQQSSEFILWHVTCFQSLYIIIISGYPAPRSMARRMHLFTSMLYASYIII